MGGSSKTVTVGYRYYMGLHMGLCMGPVDALREIRVGDRVAWSGNQTASGAITIDAPNLFGGEEREGGIAGAVDVMMGEATQGANAYLAGKQGGTQPGYRGILGLVFRGGLIAANNPYIKKWSAKATRVLAGWQNGGAAWYSTKAAISLPGGDVAMNPAHIVYECLTNYEWGLGYAPSQIDDANFRAAADVFHAEGLGLCLQWNRQSTIDAFVQSVVDHVGAVVGQDPRTGLFKLLPIRGGYDVGTLPVFGPSNIIAVDSFQRAATVEAVNEISASFVDVTTGKAGNVTVQNLANITSQGGVVAQPKAYPGLPTAELATRAALRDLRALSTPIARVRFRCNRTGYALLPGAVVRFNWPKLGVVDMVLRVLSVNFGGLTDGEITVEAAEDVFGMPATTYAAQQPSGWQDPNTNPAPVLNRRVEEAPFYELARQLSTADLQALADDAGFLSVVGSRPSGDSLNFRILTRNGGSGTFEDAAQGDFAPTATLAGALSHTATTTTLSNMVDVDLVEAGGFAMLGAEVVRVDAVNPTTGAITLGRGVLDTVAAAHTAGARIFFAQNYINADGVERVDGDVVQVRLLSRTGRGELAESLAPIDSVTFDQRHARPYPPGRFRINAQSYPVEIQDAPLVVTWAHRNRLQQNLEGDETGNIGPEPGTTYTLQLWNDATGVLIVAFEGVAGTSQALPVLSGAYTLRIELWSVRGGLASRQKHAHAFTYINIGYRITEAGDQRITEGGDARITQ